MKLQDVLHFYLGCKVEYEGIINGKELKAEIEANKHDIFYIPKVEKVIGKKIGFLRRIDQLADGRRRYRIGRKGLQTHYSTDKFKPLLRPLSSMTEEELKWYFDSIKSPEDELDNCEWVTEQNGVPVEQPYWTLWCRDCSYCRHGYVVGGVEDRYTAKQLHYLLSRGFDLFNLITSGQAIESNTLTSKGEEG
jgi:hypothetical protein